jgi:hypothetical protein
MADSLQNHRLSDNIDKALGNYFHLYLLALRTLHQLLSLPGPSDLHTEEAEHGDEGHMDKHS